MRQGNGSELLGAGDPRSQQIGVIHVSPVDDRKSVLAAILTQEKLGRKQVAVVLSGPNKTFQRSVDFDDLKNIQKKLQAQIVFIIPGGSGPAELARQRRFPVYSSLASYADALRKEDEESNGSKKGAINGRKERGTGAINDRMDKSDPYGDGDGGSGAAPFVAGAVAGGAAAYAADRALNGHQNGDPDQGALASSGYDDDEGDLLAPASGNGTSHDVTGVHPVATTQGAADGKGDEDAAGPAIIELPQGQARGRPRSTAKLAPAPEDASAPPSRPNRRRNTGNMAEAAGVGAAAGALAASGASTRSGTAGSGGAGGAGGAMIASGTASPRTVGGGAPPSRGTPGGGGGGGGGGSPRRRNPLLIGLALLLITALIICASVAYAQPSILGPVAHLVPGTGQPPATVTIVPASQVVSNSYVVTGVTGTPDPTKFQIAMRQVTGNAQAPSKTVTATGHTQTPGLRAHGILTFTNGKSVSFTVGTGTAITNSAGVTVVTDTPVVIPAANPATGALGVATGSAHAANVGTSGNIGAGTISQNCCTASMDIFVKNNNAFGGGQNPQNYDFVQQSDVNSAVTAVRDQLLQQALTSLKGQITADEQPVDGAQCNLNVTTDRPVGDKGVNVSSTDVGVSATCRAQVFNRAQLLSLVTNQLQSKATSSLGSGYGLAGQVQMTTKVQTSSQNAVSLLVNAKGVWAYQFDKTQEQQLARLIAGKPVDAAKTLLQAQKGISSVTIQVNGNTLPTNPGQIAFVIQSISGFSASSPSISLTPTVTGTGSSNGPVEPTTVPGKGMIETGS